MKLEHNINLVNKNAFGNFYEKNERSKLCLDVNPVDLKNSPDFVLLYGVEIDPSTCKVEIYYDDNIDINSRKYIVKIIVSERVILFSEFK